MAKNTVPVEIMESKTVAKTTVVAFQRRLDFSSSRMRSSKGVIIVRPSSEHLIHTFACKSNGSVPSGAVLFLPVRTLQFLGFAKCFLRIGNSSHELQDFGKATKHRRRSRVELDGLAVAGHGLIQFSHIPKSPAKSVVRLGEPGIKLDCLTVAGDGFIAMQGIAEIEVGGHIRGIELNRLLIAGDGLGPLLLAEADQRQAEVRVSLRTVGVESDGLTAARFRLRELPLPAERDAEAIEGAAVGWVEPQGLSETGDGLVQRAFRQQRIGEFMVRLVGLRTESDSFSQFGNALVQFLCLLGLPRPARHIGRRQEGQSNDDELRKKRLVRHECLLSWLTMTEPVRTVRATLRQSRCWQY